MRFLPQSIYYNLLFGMNCIRLKKSYYWLKTNPKKVKTFNEKINHLKNVKLESKARYADKIKLKEILSAINFQYPETIKIFNSIDELLSYDFSELTAKGFIIKSNHGSGMNKIYLPNALPTLHDLKTISKWFNYPSHLNSREEHYKCIEKKVFIEELIDFNIEDFKIHCFHGEPKFIQVDKDRFSGHMRNIYDTDWNKLDITINYPQFTDVFNPPSKLQDMLISAKDICKNLKMPYLRVDFYEANNELYLGELTFHPGGGVEPFDSYESDVFLGSFLNLN